MVCDSVSVYVCVLPLYVRVCVRVSRHKTLLEHTHALVIAFTSLSL